jgi:hypothetical protein
VPLRDLTFIDDGNATWVDASNQGLFVCLFVCPCAVAATAFATIDID